MKYTAILIVHEVFIYQLCLLQPRANVQIGIISRGDEKTFPKQGDEVTVHYTGYVNNIFIHLYASTTFVS